MGRHRAFVWRAGVLIALYPAIMQSNVAPQQLSAQIQALANNMQYLYNRGVAMHRRVSALEAERTLRSMGRTPKRVIEFRSQFGEDSAIWDLLRPELEAGKLQGLVIEVGAFDGVHFSVSSGLEAAGWPTLLIEAIPQRFEQCKTNRPDARVVHAALSKPGCGPTAQFTVVHDQWGGMLSYLTADEGHKQQIKANQQSSQLVTVPQTTMNALLESHSWGQSKDIDCAIIDVEGGEPDLLAGFDLHKWKPKVLVIEDNEQRDGTNTDLVMRAQLYTLLTWVSVNRVYVRNDLVSWKSRLT